MKPEVLLYNINDDDRLHKIRQYLNRSRISFRMVQAPEFMKPIGILFDMPGIMAEAPLNLSGNFKDEMLVMKDFTRDQMDDFFRFFRENQLKPVALKAMVTPVNMYWSSIALHDELVKEHAYMMSRRKQS